jgi:hypothetical protein
VSPDCPHYLREHVVAAQGHRIETEVAPIRYVAEFLGLDTDSEKAIRWLIALMVLCAIPSPLR